ncbi:uncharacterized protein F4822DRAFT_427403 [Hypoxylon trugodes]|uniref:uncharacterized protein n=1 Tax=Hypoxylon trugodes TaxID=326681 RepID=UPI002192B8EF|nr:uncharacterized protein F4822DRAFT_427403 [Hypoxylon trugodes]KAI1391552.1 hypothetical protein F4822DRAFT_427403 [Hypoxylon trugodes]
MSDVITNEGHFLRKLQPIDDNGLGSSGWPEVRLILVPDASSSQATHLSESSWAWLSPVATAARVRAHCYEFQYNPRPKGATIWQALNDGGDILLNFLLQLDSGIESHTAVVLIGHGLGGFLAKKALTRLSERYFDPAARRLSDKLTQVILIGCPHPTLDNRDNWRLLDNVLKHYRKMGSRDLVAAAEEAGIVANLCSKFQEAGIQCPVITTYDSQATKIRHWINLFKAEKHILISKDFAETGVRNEDLIPLDLENHDMRSLGMDTQSKDPQSREFETIVQSCLTQAMTRLRPHTPQGHGYLDPGAFKDSPFTMTMSEETRSIAHLQVPRAEPVDATAGATTSSSTNRSVGSVDPNPGPPRLPCHVFGHPRNLDFFGRSEILDLIDDSLLPKESKDPNDPRTLQNFAICGTGGMGKTQIALEYAHSRKACFDAIFWITADNKTSIAASFSTIALSLGIATEAEVTDLAVCFGIVMRWLSNPTKPVDGGERSIGASWLLVFDNADAIDLMSEFWPSTGIGSVLITTRDPAGKDYCLGRGISLQPLLGTDALEFFKIQLQKDTEMEHHINAEFVEKLYGLPLAIVQVAALIRRRKMTTAEFSGAYSSGIEQSGLQDYQVSQHDGNYRHSIFTVWAFESLGEKTQALLNVMSLLDPFRIQEFILSRDSLDTSESLYPKTRCDYVNSRSSLLKASLITRSLPTEHVELHPLVQEVLRSRMSGDDLVTSFSVAVTLVHASWPRENIKWHHETSHREQSAEMLAHALKLRTVYEKSLIDKVLPSRIEDLWIEVLRASGWYLYERGEHEIPLPIFLLAEKLARKRSPERPDLLADILMCLAALGIHTSSPQEVLKYAREHLDLRQQVYDSHAKNGDVPIRAQYDRAMGISTMALAYNALGDFEKAIPYAKDSLEIYYSFPTYKDVPYFAVAHMGWSLWSLGRHEDARQLLEGAVEAARKRQVKGSYGLAGILLPLGNILTSLGRLSEASSVYEEAVSMFYAANGDNYKTGQARLKYAEHLARAGHEEARQVTRDEASISYFY